MKLLQHYKKSFLDLLQFSEPGMARVQSLISKSLWPERRENPKRKVAGYYPKGFYLPETMTERSGEDIRLLDTSTGHSLFDALSPASKTRYLFAKFFKSIPPLIVPSKSDRGNWSVPCYSSVVRGLENNRDANRYLAHQEKRISNAIAVGDLELSTKIWVILAQRSWSFRASCINSTKCTKGWYYKLPAYEWSDIMQRMDDILRKWSSSVKYFRVYIPKPDGKRFRPLGVPSKAWAVVLHMIYRYLVLVLKDRISPRQYGFLPKRNGVQAWRKILELRKRGFTHMYEFDLDSCFNRISISWTLKLLSEIGLPHYFVYYMENLLTAMPIANDLKPEMELRKLRNMVVKTGLPQGFSISPLLSIFVIDAAFKAIGENPILYADDGIIMKQTKEDLTLDQIEMLARWGLHLSTKQKKDGTPGCKWIEDEFTFLGIRYSISRASFYVATEINKEGFDVYSWVKEEDMTDDMFWKDLTLLYSDAKEWDWKIDPESISMKGASVTSEYNWKLLIRWVEGSPMIKRCGMKFVDIQKESSYCTNTLLQNEKRRLRDYSIKKIKMSAKYTVPLLRIHKPSFSLPKLGDSYEPYSNFQSEIVNPLSFWLRIDQEQRTRLYKKLYGHATMFEYNISSWRDKQYADWEPNYLTTMEDSFDIATPKAWEPKEGPIHVEERYFSSPDADLFFAPNAPESEMKNYSAHMETLITTKVPPHPTNYQKKNWNKTDERLFDWFGLEPDKVLVRLTDPKIKSVSFFSNRLTCLPPVPKKEIVLWIQTLGISVVTSMILVDMYKNTNKYMLDWPIKLLNKILALYESTDTMVENISQEMSWCLSEIIGWILIAISLFLFVSLIGWYFGAFQPKDPMEIHPRDILLDDFEKHIDSLKTANNTLTDQLFSSCSRNNVLTADKEMLVSTIEELSSEIGNLKSKTSIMESLTSLLQARLESIKQTLLVVRQENINLNEQLIHKFTEFDRTNAHIDLTKYELNVLLVKLDRLTKAMSKEDATFDTFLKNVESAFSESNLFGMLDQVGQMVKLDLTAAQLLHSHATVVGDGLHFVTTEGNSDILFLLIDKNTSLLQLAELYSNF